MYLVLGTDSSTRTIYAGGATIMESVVADLELSLGARDEPDSTLKI